MAGMLPILIPRFGLAGIAYSRLLPGCAALLVYIPLIGRMTKERRASHSARQLSIIEEA